MGLEPVAEEEEEVIHFKAIYRSHNLLKRSVEPEASYSSIESVTRSPSLLPSLLQSTYSVERSERSVNSKSTVGVGSQRIDLRSLQADHRVYRPEPTSTVGAEVNASIYSAYSCLQLHPSLHLIPTVESLNLIPTATLAYCRVIEFPRSTDLQLVLRLDLQSTLLLRGYLCQDGQPRRSCCCSCSHSQHQQHG